MQNAKYIKSFSKGQVTIPKELRDKLGLGDEQWYRVFDENDNLVFQPIGEKFNVENWLSELTKLSESIDGEAMYQEYVEMKKRGKILEEKKKKLYDW